MQHDKRYGRLLTNSQPFKHGSAALEKSRFVVFQLYLFLSNVTACLRVALLKRVLLLGLGPSCGIFTVLVRIYNSVVIEETSGMQLT